MNEKIKPIKERRLIMIELMGKHPVESSHSFQSFDGECIINCVSKTPAV